MSEQDLKYLVEATLLAAGRPVPTAQLLELFDERERPSAEQLRAALDLLAADYEPRGIELIEVASGWRIQVRPRCIDVVSRLWQERASRYSRALLETLALIAYRQPITRSEIEEIRGVSISSTIMRTIQERNWIRVVGHREVPGRPELLGTTREFLDYFGLKSLDQLPTLAELRDLENIGVQLELPGGEMPAEAAAAEPEAGSENGEGRTEEVATAEEAASDEGELSAHPAQADELYDDAGEDSDEDEPSAPTLVASAEENSQDERHWISDPPGEDR
jgi:segregation and condensation protein B